MFFQYRAKPQPPPPPPRPPRAPCLRTGCTRKALRCESKAQGQGMMSFHCKDHACRQRLGNFMCPNSKEPGPSRYCEDHRRCQAEGCSLPRKCADTSQDWAYCQKHTCFLEGCHFKRSVASAMCPIHTPICLIPDCHEPRSETGLYCGSHSCVDKSCNLVINGSGWCKMHKACRVQGCALPRVITQAGQHEDVCWRHKPRVCPRSGCRKVIDGETRFCQDHECKVPSCVEAKQDGEVSGVPQLYCECHTCQSPSCTQPISDPSSPSASKHCLVHKCSTSSTPTCHHPRKPNSAHCPLHACLHPSCPSARRHDPLAAPGAVFCTFHECRAPGCDAHGIPDAGGHCAALHACYVSGCPAQRSQDGPYCAVHNAVLIHNSKIASAGVWAGGQGVEQQQQQNQAPSPPFPQTQSQAQAQTQSLGPSPAAPAFFTNPTEEALVQRLHEEQQRQRGMTRLEAWRHGVQHEQAGPMPSDVSRVEGGGVDVGTMMNGGNPGEAGMGMAPQSVPLQQQQQKQHPPSYQLYEARKRGAGGGGGWSRDSALGMSPSVSDCTFVS